MTSGPGLSPKTFGSLALRIVVRLTMWVGVQFGRIFSKLKLLALFPGTSRSSIHWSVEVKFPENIQLGHHVVIGPGCVLGAHSPIRLDDFVRLSKDVIIETAGLDLTNGPPYSHISKSIVIGKGVWIGTGAIVLGGVTIGDYAVIGAGSVVAQDIPAQSIFVGANGRTLNGRQSRLRHSS